MAQGSVNLTNQPGLFPNDSEMRGKDRRLRRQLPASDGNPRQVNHGQLKVLSIGITPEGLRPSATLTGSAGKLGLDVNDGMWPS